MNKKQLIQAIEVKRAEIAEVQNKISEVNEILSDIETNPDQYADLDSMHDDMLDEIYSEACEALPINVTGSELIRKFDPVMYRCSFSDFISNFEYKDLDAWQTAENDLDYLQSNLSDLESELDELLSDLDYLLDEEIQ